MKYLITYCFLFVFSLGLSAQTDTITFHYYDNYNELVYGVRSEGKPVYLQGKINPNYETIFERRDSTLFTGFLKMLSGEIRTPLDSFPPSNTIYKVTNGIPRLTKSISYSYHHPDTKKTFCWKAYETVVKDSTYISLSFYPDGSMKSKRTQETINSENLSVRSLYDSTGILTNQTKQTNGIRQGESYYLLNDSTSINVDFRNGEFHRLIGDKAVFYSIRNKPMTEDHFAITLQQDSVLSWGFFIQDNNSFQCEVKFVFYIRSEKDNKFILQEANGLQPGRREKLIKRTNKQCTTKPKPH